MTNAMKLLKGAMALLLLAVLAGAAIGIVLAVARLVYEALA